MMLMIFMAGGGGWDGLEQRYTETNVGEKICFDHKVYDIKKECVNKLRKDWHNKYVLNLLIILVLLCPEILTLLILF